VRQGSHPRARTNNEKKIRIKKKLPHIRNNQTTKAKTAQMTEPSEKKKQKKKTARKRYTLNILRLIGVHMAGTRIVVHQTLRSQNARNFLLALNTVRLCFIPRKTNLFRGIGSILPIRFK
jgi:hypothetical protein